MILLITNPSAARILINPPPRTMDASPIPNLLRGKKRLKGKKKSIDNIKAKKKF